MFLVGFCFDIGMEGRERAFLGTLSWGGEWFGDRRAGLGRVEKGVGKCQAAVPQGGKVLEGRDGKTKYGAKKGERNLKEFKRK